VQRIDGEAGNFEVKLTQNARYVDMEKCIACNACAEKCPKKVSNAYDGGLSKRKAVYVQYAQAVPLKYTIDADTCIYFLKGKCKACEKFCPTGAINFEDQKKDITLNVGAVVLSAGSQAFDPAVYDTYGYSKSPNIVTSLEFERILSASGPYGGHMVRPSDKAEPEKIAWLQCVGSRDTHLGARGYCSGVCCTYAVKEAILAKEHSSNGLDTAIFYIDIRTFGKDFERYYNKAKDDLGVRFVKSRITHVEPMGENGKHIIRYVDGTGQSRAEEFDIVVLSVGLGPRDQAVSLAKKLDVDLNHYQFAKTGGLDPVKSSQSGIYVCGAFHFGHRCQCRCWQGRNPAGGCQRDPDKDQRAASRNRCQGRTPANRCFCLLLRHQYCRICGCARRGRVCQNPAECGLCRAKSVQLLAGHPDPDLGNH
jgi:heterodisulfide reductase subunit A